MFYIYALINPFDNSVFYIGKGSGDRVKLHEKFKSKCNNPVKDAMIELILKEFSNVPYTILIDNIEDEAEAYRLEEEKINEIGLENLTNICSNSIPPSQKGRKRNETTIKKIKDNSKKQGKQRTIEYVINNKETVFGVLTDINTQIGKRITLEKYNITSDLYHKIKRKRELYTSILNNYTDYSIHVEKVKKIAGMQLKVFNDYKDTLIKMYRLIDEGIPRRNIAKTLNINLAFYDRMKGKRDIFYTTLKA